MEEGDITLRDRLVGLLEQIFYHGRQFEQESLHQLASEATADDIDADLALLIEASHHFWKRRYDACLELLIPWLDDEVHNAASPHCILALVMAYRALTRLQQSMEAADLVGRAVRLRPAVSESEHMVLAWVQGQAMLNLRRFDAAARQLDQAHLLALRSGFEQTGAIINIDRAIVAGECGDSLRAIVSYEASINVLSSAPSGLRPMCLAAKFNLATVYPDVGRDADALRMYAEVVDESKRWDLPGYYLTARLNMAVSLKRLQRIEEAQAAYSEVLEQASVDANLHLQHHACIGLSDLFVQLGDLVSARAMATRALVIADELHIPSLRHEAMANLAVIDHQCGDRDVAVEGLSGAFEGALRDADVIRASEYGVSLATMYASLGDFERSFRVLRTCSTLKAQINVDEIKRTAEVTALQLQLVADREALRSLELQRERMLRAVVPDGIAARLMTGERRIADAIPDATIMFVDIVGFTEMASAMDPESLLLMLEELFTTFDEICARYGCERVKTIGDSYMAICGATTPFDDHTIRMCRAALEITSADTLLPLERDRLRIGIHSGPVVAGVMSGSRLSYDVWGDTVSMAATLESTAQPGRIHCSHVVADALHAIPGIRTEKRTPLHLAEKGRLHSFWVLTA